MDIFETISQRKTIRKYSNEQPPLEDIKRIINSARVAPCAINAQNWKFIAIFNGNIKKQMANAVVDTYNEFKNNTSDIEFIDVLERYKNFSTFFKDAPVVIACVEIERTSTVTKKLEEQGLPYKEIMLYRPDSSLLSMGAAIENITLSATSLGYGTCWMCAPIIAYKKFKQILNLDEHDKIVSLLTLGKPFDNTTKQPPKKTLDEILTIIQ